MTLDVLPQGLGGVLQIGGAFAAYFSSPLTRNEQRIHWRRIGSTKASGLGSVWPSWPRFEPGIFGADSRVSVVARSDNFGAFLMGAQMRSRASPTIAREVAMVYAESPFEPRAFQHIPGVANGIAGPLSRMYEHGFNLTLPEELFGIVPTVAPERTKKWYTVVATP